jgi:flagellar hook-associated protein 2
VEQNNIWQYLLERKYRRVVANVSFLGLNSSFDSNSLVRQLVQFETQARILPLERKKQQLELESNSLNNVISDINSLRTEINYNSIKTGADSLAPKQVSSSDSSKEFVNITTDDSASIQSFNFEVLKLATNTVRKSSSAIKVDLTGASPISDANFKSGLTLSDGTVTINGQTLTYSEDADPTVSDIEDFLTSFSGVTATYNESTGKFDLSGVTSLGSSGDSSNMLEALGLNNAVINAGNVTGLKNLEAVRASTELADLGITGTEIVINGASIAINTSAGGDTLQDLITRINNSSSVKVKAAYDSLSGELILSNTDTGALSITVSSDGDVSALNLNNPSSETLGSNAEFTISTLNGGETLVSNSNTVTGLLEGVTFNLKKATTGPVSVTINEDSSAYKDTVKAIVARTNTLLNRLTSNNNSFGRGLSSRIKSVLTNLAGVNGVDGFTSMIEIGLRSNLNADGKFSGYAINDELFDAAFSSSPDELNKILWGNSDDPDSIYPGMSNGNKGILVQLLDLMNSYVDPNIPTNGIINQVQDSISNQIKTVNSSIQRAEVSIEALEIRMIRQFAQLDTINAKFQQQQAAISGLSAMSSGGGQ